jgi:hypothetical protein
LILRCFVKRWLRLPVDHALPIEFSPGAIAMLRYVLPIMSLARDVHTDASVNIVTRTEISASHRSIWVWHFQYPKNNIGRDHGTNQGQGRNRQLFVMSCLHFSSSFVNS